MKNVSENWSFFFTAIYTKSQKASLIVYFLMYIYIYIIFPVSVYPLINQKEKFCDPFIRKQKLFLLPNILTENFLWKLFHLLTLYNAEDNTFFTSKSVFNFSFNLLHQQDFISNFNLRLPFHDAVFTIHILPAFKYLQKFYY